MTTLHLVALPHVELGTDRTHLCAYSGKVMKFLKMFERSERYQVRVYTPEFSIDAPYSAKMVNCLSTEDRIKTFGADIDDPNRLPTWPTDEQCTQFNNAVISEIRKSSKLNDLILLAGGKCQASIASAFTSMQCLEPFVGYDGVLLGNVFAAYESHSHMSRVYQMHGIQDIRWYDCVIPPFVDADDFPSVNEANLLKDRPYLLFVGRMIFRKGVTVAADIAKAAKMPLVLAGAGATINDAGMLKGEGFELDVSSTFQPAWRKYLGPIDPVRRNELMAGATALLMPTIYQEPGGNVAIEAMMAGCPVIAPDWGVLAETVEHCETGYHFRTIREGMEGVNWAKDSNTDYIRLEAKRRFDLPGILGKYETWFDRIRAIWTGKGWESTKPPLQD